MKLLVIQGIGKDQIIEVNDKVSKIFIARGFAKSRKVLIAELIYKIKKSK